MNTITARYRWTFHVSALGGKLFEQTRRKERIYCHILMVVLVTAIAGMMVWMENPKLAAIFLGSLALVGFFTIFITFCLISPTLKRWQFHRRPDVNTEIEWIFTPEEISLTSSLGKISGPWSSFHGVTTTIYGFLFFSQSGFNHFIPNDAFEPPEHIEALKVMARENARVFKEAS